MWSNAWGRPSSRATSSSPIICPVTRWRGSKKPSRHRGATRRYLPPYSPDLNPIEQVFVKRKALLRKAATRTVDSRWDDIGRLLSAFSPAECQHYFAASGYNA